MRPKKSRSINASRLNVEAPLGVMGIRDRSLRKNCKDTEHVNETGHYPLWDKVKFVDRETHWYTLGLRRPFT